MFRISRLMRQIGLMAKIQATATPKPGVYLIDYPTWYARLSGN
jgi:hypothetical protein